MQLDLQVEGAAWRSASNFLRKLLFPFSGDDYVSLFTEAKCLKYGTN